jgi:hypothetical protein
VAGGRRPAWAALRADRDLAPGAALSVLRGSVHALVDAHLQTDPPSRTTTTSPASPLARTSRGGPS